MDNKVTVVGAGRWGANIIRTLHAMDALASIVELDAARAKAVRTEYPGIAVFEDLQVGLDEGSAAVAIATPVPTHVDVALAALEANKDVFVEKPLALTADDASRVTALAQQRGRVLMTGHLLLYQPAVEFIAKFIASGKLGRVRSVNQVRRNLGTVRLSENALFSLGVHDLAVLMHLIGEPPQQVKVVSQSVLNPGVEDQVKVHMAYADGVQAHLDVTWLWPNKERRLTIVGEEGFLVYDELDQRVVFYDACAKADGTIINRGHSVVFEGGADPLRLEMQHFLACVADRSVPVSGPEHSVEVVRLLEHIDREIRLSRK